MSHNQWYHSLTTVFCELPSQHRLLIPHPPDWLQALTLIPKVFIFYFIDFVNFSSGAMLYLHYDGYLSVSECRNICISYCVMATMSNNSHTQDTTMTWHMQRLRPSMYKCISAINASHFIALWVSKSTDNASQLLVVYRQLFNGLTTTIDISSLQVTQLQQQFIVFLNNKYISHMVQLTTKSYND